MAYTQRFYVNCTDKIDVLNVTHDVKRAVRESKITHGIITILLPISAAGLALVENNPDIRDALRDLVVRLIPDVAGKRPDRRSKTGSVHAHLRGLVLGSTMTLPIWNGELGIGPWQEVLLYDFDDRVGRREFVISAVGDSGEEGAEGPAMAGGGGAGGGRSLPPGQAKMV